MYLHLEGVTPTDTARYHQLSFIAKDFDNKLSQYLQGNVFFVEIETLSSVFLFVKGFTWVEKF